MRISSKTQTQRFSQAMAVAWLACTLLSACNVYDLAALHQGSSKPDKSDAGNDASMPLGDGGKTDGSACVPHKEICNGVDDDCDGDVDEAAKADAYCRTIIMHSPTGTCGSSGRCVFPPPQICFPGYKNCDGQPANGCEPLCAVCGICDDAGTDDAGSSDGGN